MSVQVVVADPHTHPGLFLAVFAQRDPASEALLLEFSVMLVNEQQAWRGVASDVYIRPPVFVEVCRNHRHTIPGACPSDSRLLTDIGERTIAVIPVKRVCPRRQAARA